MTDETKTDDKRDELEPLEPLAQPHYNPYLWPGAMQDEEAAEEGATTTAGEAKPADQPVAPEAAVVEALRTVYDPEIPVNIFDLGLIYEYKIDETSGDVAILMTLDRPLLPGRRHPARPGRRDGGPGARHRRGDGHHHLGPAVEPPQDERGRQAGPRHLLGPGLAGQPGRRSGRGLSSDGPGLTY